MVQPKTISICFNYPPEEQQQRFVREGAVYMAWRTSIASLHGKFHHTAKRSALACLDQQKNFRQGYGMA